MPNVSKTCKRNVCGLTWVDYLRTKVELLCKQLPGRRDPSGHREESDPLSLANSTIQEFDPEVEDPYAKYEADCEEEYDDDYYLKYLVDRSVDPSYDHVAKRVNVMVYYNIPPCFTGTAEYLSLICKTWNARRRKLYGRNYKELDSHEPRDPRVGELLLADALRTGKWKELPDELQGEYHRRVGGQV